MTALLEECFAARSTNIKISREIAEGKEIEEISRKYKISPLNNFGLEIERKWWLERLFERAHLSFFQGTLLIYALVEIPRIVLFPYFMFSGQQELQIIYLATYMGDLILILSLLINGALYKGVQKLTAEINENVETRYVSPISLIHEAELASNEKLEQLDKKYRDYYIKPVMCKTLQLGVKLAFSKRYQLGSGVIAAGLLLTLFALRDVFKVLPAGFYTFWEPIPQIVWFQRLYTYFALSFLWFIIGMTTWTLFTVFMVTIQASGNPLRIRPFEHLKERFGGLTNLTLKTTLSITVLVGWFSPYMLVWTVFPRDPLIRQGVITFVESMLFIMIPIIVISFLVPILKIHRGMDESRERALLIKLNQLEQLKKKPLDNIDKHFKIQNHLTRDYTAIAGNSEWVLNNTQIIEIFVSVFLPILTFLLSQLR